MNNLNIGIVGRADHDNFGDSLMFAFYVHYLNKLNANVYIVEASQIFMKRLHELDLNCQAIELKKCYSLDKVVFVGGGYFGQPDIKTKQWLNNFKSDSYFYNIAKYLNENDVAYYIHGVEIGPLDDNECREMVKFILNNSKGVIVRNLASQVFVEKVLGSKSEFLRDVVLEVTQKFSEELSITNVVHDEPHIVIHGTGKFFKDNPISKLFRKQLFNLVKKNGFRKVSILFDQSTYPELVITAKSFSDELNDKLNIKSCVVEYQGIKEVLSTIISSSHIVTTKLHIGVVGLSYGKKVFCISNMDKNKRFYNEIFDGQGRVSLFQAIYNPFVWSRPKFICGNDVSNTERKSSLDNILQLEAFLIK